VNKRNERKVLDTNHDRPFAPAPTRSGRRDEIHNEHKYNTVSHQMHAYVGIAWLIMSSRRVHRARSLTHAQSLQGRTTGTELADLTTDTSPAVDGTHCAGNSNRHHWCAHGPSQCKGKAPHLSSSHACGPRAQIVCKHAMRNHLPCESRSALSLTFFVVVFLLSSTTSASR